MNLRTRWSMAAFVVIALALCQVAVGADAPQYPWIRPDGSLDYQKFPRRPQPGDKLGYPKAQSAQLLQPPVRAFLDAVARLYSEDELFLEPSKAIELLGTQPERMRILREGQRNTGYSAALSPTGVFARPGWNGHLIYVRPHPDGRRGSIDLVVRIDPAAECVDSKAVEGYLDLDLQPGLDSVPPIPPQNWDRHALFGRPFALALSERTPELSLFFTRGCLSRLDLGIRVLNEEQIR